MDMPPHAPTRCAEFDNSFARLPADFFARVQPTPLAATRWSASVTRPVSCSDFHQRHWAVAGTALDRRFPAVAGRQPLAMCYAGHQFGHYVPQLGDGRAIVLGEVTGADDRRWELQIKGGQV